MVLQKMNSPKLIQKPKAFLMEHNPIFLYICMHCNEKHQIQKWGRIAEKISLSLGRDIHLKPQNSIYDLKASHTSTAIHYANLDQAIELIRLGYIPVAKLKEDRGILCPVASEIYSPEKETITLALINKPYLSFPALFFKRIDTKKVRLIFSENYDEIITLLKEKKADIGFIYTGPESEGLNLHKLKILDDFCFPVPHFILIHPSLEEYRDRMLAIEDFETILPEEIEKFKDLYTTFDVVLKESSSRDILDLLTSSPNLGIIVHFNDILFASRYATELLGYSDEELYRMKITDIIYPGDIEKVKANLEKRLKGEKFLATYEEIRLQRKDHTIAYVQAIANSITFQGKNAGFVIFYDITQSKLTQKAKEVLLTINKIITQCYTEEEIYSRICQALVENLNLVFAWVAIVDTENKRLIPRYQYGDDRGILQIFDYSLSDDNLSLTTQTITKGEICLNQDSRDYAQRVFCAQELVKRNFMSSCTIPLSRFGKVVSLLKAYSDIPNFFSPEVIELFEEIKLDISFALERVERLRENMIIAEALKNSDTWILVTDKDGTILYVNDAVEKISGYTKDELIGQNPRIFKSGLVDASIYKDMWETILSGQIYEGIIPNRKKSGKIFHSLVKIIPLELPGKIIRFVAVAKDVTREVSLSYEVKRLMYYDALTGLLNFNGFFYRVTDRLSQIDHYGLIILIDICNMSYLNKLYGISSGDNLLRKFSDHLKDLFKKTDLIARISGDNFGAFMEVENSDEIYITYSKIYELRKISLELENTEVPISINAGIAIFPTDGKHFNILYERASVALQNSKKKGPGEILFFAPDLERQVEKIWEAMNLIRRAVDKNLFVFYYQPFFHTNSLRLAGLESLVRIRIEDGKIYTPNFFIDYLENSHFIDIFEHWAVKEITDKIYRWNINISLNISAKTFSTPSFQDIISMIPEDIKDMITIEITERALIENIDYTIRVLRDIKQSEHYPKIAIDDFGTGYSSIIYLKDLPIDILKIDSTFIRNMTLDKKSLAIVQTIIDLAKKLEIKTLAEGVETEEQLNILKQLDCDYVQGFLFSRPVPENEILRILNPKRHSDNQ